MNDSAFVHHKIIHIPGDNAATARSGEVFVIHSTNAVKFPLSSLLGGINFLNVALTTVLNVQY